ncbi:MAG: DUF4157 domain-containing protein, partial [Cyanobacteriota bacterium]
ATEQVGEQPDLQTQLDRATRFGHPFSRVKVYGDLPQVIQPKLVIGPPGDKYEQEADQVAARVMAMPKPVSQSSAQRQPSEESKSPLTASILRAAQRQEPQQPIQRKSLLQRRVQSDGSHEASSEIETQLNKSKGSGSPLPNEVRSFMEPRFGADFSGVRVHTGGEAVQMNRELGAQAFTHGSDVYFGAGKSPGNNELTAHELTHVVQQKGAAHIQREAEPTNHEEMLDKAINIVQDALDALTTQTTNGDNPGITTAPKAEEQEHGLQTALAQLLSLKGSGKTDEILRATQPILAGSQGDLSQANSTVGQQRPQQETDQTSTPTIQRNTLVVGAPLLAGGPPGWAIYAGLAVLTLAATGVIAYEATRSRTREQERVEPRVIPRERDEKPNTMRFQVQWGTNQGGPTFSQIATAPSSTGVTTVQAITALEATVANVTPDKAQKAALPAKTKQIAWISSRPPAGIATGGYSKSEYFHYKNYTDARVDVENIRGHNLRV